MEDRVHLLGIRHHGPGSAALLVRALDALDPSCVLIEGPPEADELLPYVGKAGMRPPVALLHHGVDQPRSALFSPFAEYSPEWQAILWALAHDRPLRSIDWSAGAALAALESQPQERGRPDPLDALAEAAGYSDGESFWNALVEQGGREARALAVFQAIGDAMAEARAAQEGEGAEAPSWREQRREASMRTHIRQALKDHQGPIAVVVGAWHVPALRSKVAAAEDRALLKDLPKVKVESTWVPWTDRRLSMASGYGAGVISPGWYRHLWSLYSQKAGVSVETFAAVWQAKTAALLRGEGFPASTASAIEAARLALGLAALRGVPVPGLTEMHDAALSSLCHGNETAITLVTERLYFGERVGEIDASVPQMPLAEDLALWQRKTRLKPEALDCEVTVDLRTEAGLLKSTLLHRLNLIRVPWGQLIEAEAGRGTFRELWRLRWEPEFSVALADALVFGVTVEQAAAGAALAQAEATRSISALTELIQATLVADLGEAANACIDRLQTTAVHSSDMTDLMNAVPPLVRILRYGTARRLPKDAIALLIGALAAEVNAGARTGSHHLDEQTANERWSAMVAYDEALGLWGDEALLEAWQRELEWMVDDDQVAPTVAGLSLRRLHGRSWGLPAVEAAFSRHIGQPPASAGAFLESFLRGSAEVLLQDQPLLHLVDEWLTALPEEDFLECLPLLRRSFAAFDPTAKRRLVSTLSEGVRPSAGHLVADSGAFQAALPLLQHLLGIPT